MKRLVLLGEGQGEVSALPILIGMLLREKKANDLFYIDRNVIRTTPSNLVRWDKGKSQPDYSKWVSRIELAARKRDVGGVLAIYDGDLPFFPAGSPSGFCAATAAKAMAFEAVKAGAGKMFSLAVVFARSEYESWLVAGAESLAGRKLSDGRPALPLIVRFPAGDPEAHGKRWLMQNYPGYRPTRDQAALTELIDLKVVRSKKLRSFQRLEHALEQLVEAVAKGQHVSTPD